MLALTKGTSAITVGTSIEWTAGGYALDRQYVSEPLSAGITFDSSVTVKGQLLTAEGDPDDNVDRILLAIKVVSQDGTVLRRTLLDLGDYGGANEFPDSGYRNKYIANGDALAPSSPYTTVSGDRLVVEIGYTDITG